MSRPIRIAVRIFLGLALFAVVAVIAGIFVVRSGWFQNYVREKIISRVEDATGGRAELHGFHFQWNTLTATATDLIIHGTEPPQSPPLFEASRIVVRAKIFFSFDRVLDLQYLGVDRPAIHVFAYGNGRTNIPAPKKKSGGKSGLETFVDLAIDRIAISQGNIQFLNYHFPLDVQGRDVRAEMQFDSGQGQYHGQLGMTVTADYRSPVNAKVAIPVVIRHDEVSIANAHIETAGSSLTANVDLRHMSSPQVTFQAKTRLSLTELASATGTAIHVVNGSPGVLEANISLESDQQGIRIQNGSAELGRSHMEISGAGGTMANFRGAFSLDQLARLFDRNQWPGGLVQVAGVANLREPNYSVTGTLTAPDVNFKQLRIGRVQLTSSFRAVPDRIEVPRLTVKALGGEMNAAATILNFRSVSAKAELHNFALDQITRHFHAQPIGYSGILSGNLSVAGDIKNADARANIHISPGQSGVPVSGGLEATYLAADHVISITNSSLQLPHSRFEITGEPGRQAHLRFLSRNLRDLAPAVRMISPSARVPVQLEGGTADLAILERGPLNNPQLSGDLNLRAFTIDGRRFDQLAANFSASPSRLAVSNGVLTRGVSRAQFAGSVGLRAWKPSPSGILSADIDVQRGEIADFTTLAGESRIPVSGNLAASIHIRGTVADPAGEVHLTVLDGRLYEDTIREADLLAELSDKSVKLDHLELSSEAANVQLQGSFTHLRNDFESGTVHIQVNRANVTLSHLETLQNRRPGLSGSVDARGDISGELSHNGRGVTFKPISLNGTIRTTQIRDQRELYGDLSATLRTEGATVSGTMQSTFAGSEIEAHGTTVLNAQYPMNATFSVRHLAIEKAAAIVSAPISAAGLLNAQGTVTGAISDPHAAVSIDLSRAQIYREPIQKATAAIDYTNTTIGISSLHITAPAGDLSLSGSYSHAPGSFASGRINASVEVPALQVARVAYLRDRKPGLTGIVTISGDILADIRSDAKGQRVFPLRVNADGALKSFSSNGVALGDATLKAHTAGKAVALSIESNLANASIRGRGEIQLGADYSSQLDLTFANVTYSGVQKLLNRTAGQLEAKAAGQINFRGPLMTPRDATAQAEVTQLEVSGAQNTILKNSGPISLRFSQNVVRVENARLTGPSTDIAISGSADMSARGALDLTAKANADLAVIKTLSPGAAAGGTVDLTANIRGTRVQPDVHGTLMVKNASIQLANWPNGIYNGNGVISFTGSGGSIQSFTAQSGGGDISMHGIFGYNKSTVNYDLRADAHQVRTRYSGASVTANASVTLSGNLKNGRLNGTVTITRVGYGQQSDIGSILSAATTPPAPPSAGVGPLSAIHANIRIQTASNVQFQTTLAQELSATADLTMLGSLQSPGIVGRVNVTGGTLIFFGNKYAVDRGSVSFYDANTIRPILDIDLETSAQGVSVNLTVSGPIDDLKLTYRSDPPLKFEDIIALLAAGKTPPDPTIAANQPAAPDQSAMQMGESAILGQAVANPIASRLQRVFGVSQLTIAPTFVSGTALPQARVTIQQQVSSVITFTYSQNLSETNSELIRIEWQLTPRFSAVATRDENGIFGVDFYYKKSFH